MISFALIVGMHEETAFANWKFGGNYRAKALAEASCVKFTACTVQNLKYNEKQESVSIASLTFEGELSGDSHRKYRGIMKGDRYSMAHL